MPFNSFLNYPMSWKRERSKLKRPIYLSLAEQLEKDIAAGFLLPGTKLPPQRELADFLDISFTTVTRAYRICELKGLIYAVTGSGTFVAPNAAKSVTISTDNLTGSLIDLGFVSSFEQCNDMISDTIVSVMKKRQFTELLDYEYPTGMPHHKAAAVNWLKGLGVQTDTEHLAIASGTLNAIALTLLALSVLLQSYYNNDLRAQKSRPRRSDRQVRHDTDRGRHPCVLECRHFKRLCRACLPLSAGTIGLYQRYFQTLMFRTACRLSGVRRPFPGTDPQCDLQCK